MRRIAVVDDDPGVLRALGRLLRSANFEVAAYSSGREFLGVEDGGGFECVVLDIHMPEITGFDVQRRLSRRGDVVPVVIITSDDTPDARKRALALGAKHYLCKPIDEAVLLDAINSVGSSPGEGREH
jgi:FixJ family two-component response regulator